MAAEPTIGLISCDEDVHLGLVTPYLAESEYLIINPKRAIYDGTMSFRDGALYYENTSLRTLRAIWFRRPAFFYPQDAELSEIEDPDEREYACSALNQMNLSVFNALEYAFWLPSLYHRLHRANDKEYQQRIARRLGFNVPRTVTTSDPRAAQRFVVDSPGPVVAKSLAPQALPGKMQVTHQVPPKAGIEFFEGLRVEPTIFQTQITRVTELRVTVVGDSFFAAKVGSSASDSNPAIQDWRPAQINGTFVAEPVELDRNVQRLCRAYLRAMDLNFGAFDFIVDDNGVHWFLECNPNGQWGFIEQATGQPIGRTIARTLIRAARG